MNARTYLTIPALLAACVVLMGCDAHPILPAGTQCAVEFRRDALGAASNVPIPAETDNYNGAQVSLTGTLKSMSSDWIIVTQGKTEYWIARDAVLMLKVQPNTPSR